jgi:phosphoenolpyruvate carboxykinase (GTP)
MSMDRASWQRELALHEEFFRQLSPRLPAQLTATMQQIEKKLAA